jgi:hypothetical protein
MGRIHSTSPIGQGMPPTQKPAPQLRSQEIVVSLQIGSREADEPTAAQCPAYSNKLDLISFPASQRHRWAIGPNGLLTFHIDLPQVLDDIYKSGAGSLSASQLSQAVVGFNRVITCWNQAASRQHFGVWWQGTSGQVAEIAVTQSVDQFFQSLPAITAVHGGDHDQ